MTDNWAADLKKKIDRESERIAQAIWANRGFIPVKSIRKPRGRKRGSTPERAYAIAAIALKDKGYKYSEIVEKLKPRFEPKTPRAAQRLVSRYRHILGK